MEQIKWQNILSRAGVHAEAIHGEKSQTARQRALSLFKTGQLSVCWLLQTLRQEALM